MDIRISNGSKKETYRYSLKELFKKLYIHVGKKRKKQLFLLFLLMIASAFSEVISIGLILPFLSVLLDPNIVFESKYLQTFNGLLNITSSSELVFPITIMFGSAALLAGFIRLTLLFATTRFAYTVGSDITVSIYRKTLYQPYQSHINKNSSEVINVMVSKANATIQSTLIPILQIVSSFTMLTITLTFLISIEPLITFFTFLGFGLIYLVVMSLTNYKVSSNSKRISLEHNQVVKLLQEGLGGIRDIILNRNQEFYTQMYRKSDVPLRKAQGINVFIGASPRFGIEALAMSLLGLMAYYSTLLDGGISRAIPLIGMLALGAQRVLPVIQQIFQSWSSILSARASVEDTIEFLDQELPEFSKANYTEQIIKFKKNIKVQNISFRYNDNEPWVFKDLSLNIEKSTKIGIVGATGSGKSTLIDILMGLLKPTSGKILIDQKELSERNMLGWQKKISQVPQNIFLSDNTIAKNIAFGINEEEIDYQRIEQVAQTAKIKDTILSWPSKFETKVGERGIRLSGGQIQRIAIARALYRNSEVIIFDEATSALDSETEKQVVEDINNLDKDITIIMIAHRISSLEGCNQIFQISKNGIIDVA